MTKAKEKTAVDTNPAPTGHAQPPSTSTKISISPIDRKSNTNAPPLRTIHGKALLSMQMPPLKYIVAPILPIGLHILAGSPKVGKSWLALWLCHKVANGELVWAFETFACTTLYLSLEDTLDRLHYRLSSITEDGSEQAFLSTDANSLSNGLTEQIERFVSENPQTGLIVIDTLQRVREVSTESNIYANDYIELRRFKQLSDKLGIAILLVHHTRKMPDSDPFNKVSGSTGIIGAVDGAFILEKENRLENMAKLNITGRDIEDMQLTLTFDRESNVWEMVSQTNAEQYAHRPIIAALIALLADKKMFSGTATQLLTLLREINSEIVVQPNHLTRSLRENAFMLEQKHGIVIKHKKSGCERTLTASIRGS